MDDMEEKKSNYPNHKGELNPMYGKQQTEEAKERISTTQKKRFKSIKEILEKLASQEELAEIFALAIEKAFSDNNLVVFKEVEENDEKETE